MVKASRGGRTPRKKKFDIQVELDTGTSSPGMYSCSLRVVKVKKLKPPKRRK